MLGGNEGPHVQVLVVEDDPAHAHAVEKAVEGEGWDVAHAESVEEAGEAVDGGNDLDIAVVDYRLPDGTGLDVLDDLRRDAPGVPVVFLTGRGDEEVAMEALSRGAVRYIVKGDDPASDLPDVLREVAEGWSGVEPVEAVEEPEPEPRKERGETGSPFERPVTAQVESEGDQDLDDALEDLLSPPIVGIGVYDDRGGLEAARFPEAVDTDAAGVLAAAVTHQFEGLAGAMDLGIQGQILMGRGDNGTLGVTVVPGPLLVLALFEEDTDRDEATQGLFEVARAVWEAHGGT